MTLLKIAQRNIRQHLAKASFALQVDRLAANNCLDVIDEELTALEWTNNELVKARTRLAAIEAAPTVATVICPGQFHVNSKIANELPRNTNLIARPAKD